MSASVTKRGFSEVMSALLIPATIRRYHASWLGPDLLAGLTLVAIAVPEQMATAKLAGMPAIVGLYAFVAGSLAFAVLGLHRHLSVGADSTIAPILAAGVAAIATVGSSRYTHLMPLLALMVGILVVAVGLLHLGWISEFLSTPAVAGVLAGIAVQIIVHQLPSVLGVAGGGTTTVGRLRDVFSEIGHANGWSAGIAAGTFAAVVLSKRVDRRIPGALIGLVASTLLVAAFNLKAHGVPVLGVIHRGLPAFGVSFAGWADVSHLIGPALTVAFVCVVQTAATVRSSNDEEETAAQFDRDIAAVGAGSLVAGLCGSFAVDSSPPRTEIVRASGGRSQLTSVFAAAAVLGIALAATGLFGDLPEATLGGILIFIASRLLRVRDLASVFRFDRLEFALAVVTLLIVALVGIEQGVVVAMLVSLAQRTHRAARPRDAVLGRELGTDHWIPSDLGRATEQEPGVVVFQVYAPLWYGDAEYVKQRVHELLATAAQPVHALVLDVSGMSDIDFTGARMVGALAAELKERGVLLAVARASHLVHHDLKHAGLLAAIGPDHVFASVQEAVDDVGKRA